VDVRVLSATHKDLGREVQNNRFRQDLFYRINVIELQVPPLRDRPEDIPQLSEHFLQCFSREAGTKLPALSDDAMAAIRQHTFPGNVRELENILERAFTLCNGSTITARDLQLPNPSTVAFAPGNDSESNVSNFGSIDDYLGSIEKELLLKALEKNRWNKTATARELGISFRQMRYKLQKFDLD